MFKMKSKFLMLLLLVGLVFTLFLPSSTAQQIDSAKLDVVMQSYEPFPAEPGSYITIKFRVTNIGSRTAPNVAFELDPLYPFSVDSNEKLVRTFGSLLPGQSVVFDYKVRVDENAVIGSNNLRLKHATDRTNFILKDLEILVRMTESVLSVSRVYTEPSLMSPGQVSDVNIDLSNLGASALRDIAVRLNLDAPVEAATTQVGLPFSPVGSTSEKRVRMLSGGDTQTLTFRLMTYPNADSRIYRVPISISYSDEAGNIITKTDVVGLLVGSEPRVVPSVSGVNLNPARTEVSLRFVNRGTIDLKFFNVRLKDSPDFRILSTSDEYYIGRLSSDDFDIASFIISFPSNSDLITLPLEIEYMDANNNEFVEEVFLELDIDSLRTLQSANGKGAGGTLVFIIVLAVVAFFIYKKVKKKRKH